MNRSELITIVANRMGMDEILVYRAVLLLLKQITEELCIQERVEVRGFGRWVIKHYKNKKLFNNPTKKERFLALQRPRPRFKAGKELAYRVNQSFWE